MPPKSSINQKLTFEYHPIKLDRKGRLVYRWYDFVKMAKRLIKSEFDLSDFDSVVASDLYALPIASWAKKNNSHLNHIYDSREVYSALGSLSNRPITQRIISFIEKRYIKNVNKVSVSGSRDRDYIENYFPSGIEYYVIKNLPPFREIVKNNYLRKRFGILEEEKIAIYQGAISEGRGIEKSILAFADIKGWHFCIVGDGTHYDRYKELAADIPNIHFTGSMPYRDLHEVTCSADLGLSLIEPISISYKYALPNKLFEYFMAGLPVLATDMPPIVDVITETGGGRIISGELKVDDIISSINSFDREIMQKLSGEAKSAAKEYSYGKQSHLIKSILSL